MKKTGLVCIELSLLFLRFSLQKNNIVSNVISWKTVVSVQSRFEKGWNFFSFRANTFLYIGDKSVCKDYSNSFLLFSMWYLIDIST